MHILRYVYALKYAYFMIHMYVNYQSQRKYDSFFYVKT